MARGEHRGRWWLVLLAGLAALAVAAACGGGEESADPSTTSDAAPAETAAAPSTAPTSAPAGEPVKIAFIYAGDPASGTWDQAIDEGRLAMEQALGDLVETTAKFSVPQGPQAAQVIDSLVQDGNQLIIATSFGYNDQMLEAAKKHPDVKFIQSQQAELLDNLGSYDLALEDAYYLGGMLLAAATEDGKLGFVGSFPIPTIVANVNAVALGAQQIYPDATVTVVWTNSWYDPIKEKQAAEGLVAGGAGAVADDVGDPAVGQALQATKTPWFSYSVDQSSFAPDSWFSGALINYEPYFSAQAQALADGSWSATTEVLDMTNGGVYLGELGQSVESRVSADAIAQMREKEAALEDGSFEVFTGPIVDQEGNERIATGAQIDPADRAGMNWFVQGVIGEASA
ncbi:MAG: BMP family ABC transporter substrate-binding protein [Chloroflexota bacterium]